MGKIKGWRKLDPRETGREDAEIWELERDYGDRYAPMKVFVSPFTHHPDRRSFPDGTGWSASISAREPMNKKGLMDRGTGYVITYANNKEAAKRKAIKWMRMNPNG